MQRYSTFIFLILLAVGACQNESTSAVQVPTADELLADLARLQGVLKKAQDVNTVRDSALLLIEMTETLYENYKEHERTPKLLFQAADVSRGVGEYGNAIRLWGIVWRDYPSYERAPDAMFFQGFTYDVDLEDADNARRYYGQFLERYPDHPIAEEVKKLWYALDKTPEDMIREFEQRKENQE